VIPTFFKELFNPQIKNLFTARQRAIYVYCLLVISACSFVGFNRLMNEAYFLFFINATVFLSLLIVMYIAKRRHIMMAGILLSLTILAPSVWVIYNNPSRLGDNAMYIAFVPIVNLFLMRDKRISLVIFIISTVVLAYLFGKAQLAFMPFLTIFLVHMVYFFFFSIHIDKLETELIKEDKRKQTLINDLEMKNEEIEQLNRVLQEKVADIQQFAYLSSHNFQTPLNNIQVYSNLLKKDYTDKLDEVGNTSIDYLHKSANSLSTILHGLVDYFSAYEAVKSEKLPVEEIIKEILTEESAIINQEKVSIKFESLPIIFGKRKEIKRLFQSIIQNALTHNQSVANLQIEILAKEVEDKIQFSVMDNGVGIPQKDFEKIFKIYVSNISFSRGMGLAIAKKIVTNYNGNIWVESILGKGTTMHFTLKTKILNNRFYSSTSITSTSADY